MSTLRILVGAGMVISLAGCSGNPTTRRLVEDAVAAMGGGNQLHAVRTVVMKGGVGTRFKLGQTVRVSDAETPATLKNVVEILDLERGLAALDYEIQIGPFGQHRREVLTKRGDSPVGLEDVAGRPLAVMSPSGLFSWGTQNHPEFLLRRNIVSVMAAALMSAPDQPAQDLMFNGKNHKFGTAVLGNGETIGLYFDPDSKLLAGFEATDTEAMLGDVPAQYILSDYRLVGGLQLPHKITIRKMDQPYSEVQFASMAVNDDGAAAVFAIPPTAEAEVGTAIAAGEYSPVTLSKIADGVYLARAYSHNSMVVEFPTWLAVVEAAYTDAQSATLVRVLGQQFPGKPIRYAIVTHHHYDHTGGVRGLAAAGATILAVKGHEPALRMIVESPHTNPLDALETARKTGKPGQLEIYEGKKVLTEGSQSLELYPITGNPHVDPKVLVYVPGARALFQSDLFIPGVGAPAGPDAVHLLQSIRALNLRVDTNVGGHGGVGPFAELVTAVDALKK